MLFQLLSACSSSPALSALDSDAASPTIDFGAASTTFDSAAAFSTKALETFSPYYDSHTRFNETDGGYYPASRYCGTGTSCADACGDEAEACYGVYCYYPNSGETCFADGTGYSCGGGYFETVTGDNNDYCCKSGHTYEECASSLGTELWLVQTNFYPAASSTTRLSMQTEVATAPTEFVSGTTISLFTVVRTSRTRISSAVPTSSSIDNTPLQTPTAAAALHPSSSSSSSMTTGAKIGVGIGVPTAVISLGLLGVFFWLRRRRQQRLEPRRTTHQPPWEVDAQESQLTAVEYERKKNERPPEDDENDMDNNGDSGFHSENRTRSALSSALEVSPLNTNGLSTINTGDSGVASEHAARPARSSPLQVSPLNQNGLSAMPPEMASSPQQNRLSAVSLMSPETMVSPHDCNRLPTVALIPPDRSVSPQISVSPPQSVSSIPVAHTSDLPELVSR